MKTRSSHPQECQLPFGLAKFLLGFRKTLRQRRLCLAVRTALHLVSGLLDAFLRAAASSRMLVFTVHLIVWRTPLQGSNGQSRISL